MPTPPLTPIRRGMAVTPSHESRGVDEAAKPHLTRGLQRPLWIRRVLVRCSLNPRYREPLERRPGTLNHRLEQGVGLLPPGEEERIRLT
jgi:hypothetical protein